MIDPKIEQQIKELHQCNLMGELKEIIPFLDNKELTDVHLYGDGRVIAEHFIEGRIETGVVIPEATRLKIIHFLASMNNTGIDYWDNPTLEGILPEYNIRLTAVIAPWVHSPEITLRRPAGEIFTLEQYRDEGRISGAYYTLLCESIEHRKNIIIGGATGSGKTTFTNACLEKMREYTPFDRFLIIEDTPELQSRASDKTVLYIRKDQARKAVEFAMRWHPKRIIFGELRSGIVARELLECWNTGHSGNLTTIHADTAESIIRRLEGMLREVIRGTLPDIRETIELLVHLTYKPAFGPVVDSIVTL